MTKHKIRFPTATFLASAGLNVALALKSTKIIPHRRTGFYTYLIGSPKPQRNDLLSKTDIKKSILVSKCLKYSLLNSFDGAKGGFVLATPKVKKAVERGLSVRETVGLMSIRMSSVKRYRKQLDKGADELLSAK